MAAPAPRFLNPDGGPAQQFLRDCFLEDDVVALLRLRRVGDRRRAVLQDCLPAREAWSDATRARLEKENAEGYDVYFGVNPVREAHRGKGSGRSYGDLACVARLHIDLDKNSRAGMRQIQRDVEAGVVPSPSTIVESSPDKYHLMWNVDPHDFAVGEASRYNRALVERYGGDAACTAPTSVLRLPGYINRKPDYSHERVCTARRLQHPAWQGTASVTHGREDFTTLRALSHPDVFPDDSHALRVERLREYRIFSGPSLEVLDLAAHDGSGAEDRCARKLEQTLLDSLRPRAGTLAPSVELAIRDSAPERLRPHLPELDPDVAQAPRRGSSWSLHAAEPPPPGAGTPPAPQSGRESPAVPPCPAPPASHPPGSPEPAASPAVSPSAASPAQAPPSASGSSPDPAAAPAPRRPVPLSASRAACGIVQPASSAAFSSAGGLSSRADQSQSGVDWREVRRRLTLGVSPDDVVTALEAARSSGPKAKPKPLYYAVRTVTRACQSLGLDVRPSLTPDQARQQPGPAGLVRPDRPGSAASALSASARSAPARGGAPPPR